MIIDGKKVADDILKELKGNISGLKDRKPTLAVILVGENPASKIYVNRKKKACQETGFNFILKELPKSTTQAKLIEDIENLNTNKEVDGILVQLPLPKQIDEFAIISSIDPHKDVDGFHPINVGKMLVGEKDTFFPCTAYGIQILLNRYGIETAGKHVLIVGRSNIVGKPLAALLMQKGPMADATVTVAHSKTKNLAEICKSADIIIAAIGRAKFVTADMVKEGACVIDVGINKIDDPTAKKGYKIVGDTDFENLVDKCSYITPVPGGVGPMTIAILLQNTLQSFLRRQPR